QKGANRFLVAFPFLFSDGLEGFINLFEGLFTGGFILLGLFRIVDQYEPAAALPITDNHFFYLQVLPNSGKSSPLGQNLLVDLLVVPEFLSDNVMTTGLLKGQAVLFRAHPPVHDPDASAQLPSEKIILDR